MHRRDGKLIVAATDLVGFLECGHLTNLDRAAVAGLIHKPKRDDDPEVELLRHRGKLQEGRYIKLLEADGRTLTNLDVPEGEWTEYEERERQTIDAMRRGDDVIFQATFFDGRWVGHPDFLLRVGEPGELGKDHYYEVADTKLAHSAKAGALIQICSYVEQVERVQGRQPDLVYVVTGGAEAKPHPFRTAEMMAYYRLAKSRFEEALDDAQAGVPSWPIQTDVSYPDPVDHCAVCRWYPDYCLRQWHTDDALPLVAGITRTQRQALTLSGTRTMTGLSELTQPITIEGLKRGQKESLWRAREQARLQVETGTNSVPVYELLPPERDSDGALVADRGLSALPPPSDKDLFFDIEGDPFAFWEGLEYLFGIWEKPTPGSTLWDQDGYRGFWAMNRVEEKKAFERVIDLFIERWRANPQMHIYHYGVYEPAHLKILAGRHATREEELDQLLRGRVFVDLFRVVKQGVRVGAPKYSIKNLEPLYGYEREVELRDAGSSIVEFERVLEIGDPDNELKRKIEAYNRDDCISTEQLRDWLEARRPDASAAFNVELSRPPHGDVQPPSEDLSERIRQVQELTDRLTSGIPTQPEEQTPAQKTTWLVANLLDWHRREDKSTWWRYYDLLSRNDEELLEESDSMGGLKYLERWHPGGKSRSYVYRYTFPDQEHKIELGYVDDPEIEGDKKRTGEVVALDEETGTIDIRRSTEWDGSHPASLVQIKWVPPVAMREALMRFGNWVAENGIDSDADGWRAARDLLLRKPPRLVGGGGGRLAAEGESGSDAALRLAARLGGTTLAIQGPPGSGKTYTGARMIQQLVGEGKRVGITSNSHKVVCNLIEAVLEAGNVRVIQKGKEHEVFDHPSVKRAEKVSEVVEGLIGGLYDVGAGTPWLWADDEMAGTVETLFVDEAGQVSLANVIAVSGAARNLVLLGDPQQLEQPSQGVHPEGAGVSALTHFIEGKETVPPERGLFLERTYRMHPRITSFTSRLFYEDKLASVAGLENQEVLDGPWAGSGLRWVPVSHTDNKNESREEAEVVVQIVNDLVGRTWRDKDGTEHPLEQKDLRIVSPFNAHRILIERLLRAAGLGAVQVGTVDKFQGQEAPVSIYTMATSRPEDAPRGMPFLFNLHRLNVATSRARALAIVVASPELLKAVPKTPEQLRMANGLAAFVESAAEH